MTPVDDTSRISGKENAAPVPKPFAYPSAPIVLPAIVCTMPEERLTARMRFPEYSIAYSTRALSSSATPRGPENVARAPIPSEPPAVSLPARVVTLAVVKSIRLRRLLIQSATYKNPLGCHTADVGLLNCALVPLPSAKPQEPLPASVVTDTVKRSIARTLQLSCSTT